MDPVLVELLREIPSSPSLFLQYYPIPSRSPTLWSCETKSISFQGLLMWNFSFWWQKCSPYLKILIEGVLRKSWEVNFSNYQCHLKLSDSAKGLICHKFLQIQRHQKSYIQGFVTFCIENEVPFIPLLHDSEIASNPPKAGHSPGCRWALKLQTSKQNPVHFRWKKIRSSEAQRNQMLRNRPPMH